MFDAFLVQNYVVKRDHLDHVVEEQRRSDGKAEDPDGGDGEHHRTRGVVVEMSGPGGAHDGDVPVECDGGDGACRHRDVGACEQTDDTF